MLIFPVILLAIISSAVVAVNFIYFLINGKQKTSVKLFKIIELWTGLILPSLFLSFFDLSKKNDCCSDSAIFSPEHRIGIYLLLIACMSAYTISIFRQRLLTPILELLLNFFLILGLVLNIMLCVHLNTVEEGPLFWIFGDIPIIMLLLIKLNQHHKILTSYIDENEIVVNNILGKLSLSILKLRPIMKYPTLCLLLVPMMVLLSLFLILFGQKPDSLIKALTDTYKHGFSQLDYMCDNVYCGGHFLCSIGANGHASIVRPIRYGERNGIRIICNRQLLISNAFEDFVQENLPLIHKFIRRNYNSAGHFIHQYYDIFSVKIVSDFVYFLMKPLEWVFLLTLYTFDQKPENRIAIQYLSKKDRQLIDEKVNAIQQKL